MKRLPSRRNPSKKFPPLRNNPRAGYEITKREGRRHLGRCPSRFLYVLAGRRQKKGYTDGCSPSVLAVSECLLSLGSFLAFAFASFLLASLVTCLLAAAGTFAFATGSLALARVALASCALARITLAGSASTSLVYDFLSLLSLSGLVATGSERQSCYCCEQKC